MPLAALKICEINRCQLQEVVHVHEENFQFQTNQTKICGNLRETFAPWAFFIPHQNTTIAKASNK